MRGALFGLALFILQNIAVWAGAAHPPKGAVPLFQIRNYDASQYLGFLTLAKDHILFPNLHMAWKTEPAMWNPLFVAAGRVGWWAGSTPEFTLKALEALMLMWAGIVVAWLLSKLFDTTAQRTGALVVA